MTVKDVQQTIKNMRRDKEELARNEQSLKAGLERYKELKKKYPTLKIFGNTHDSIVLYLHRKHITDEKIQYDIDYEYLVFKAHILVFHENEYVKIFIQKYETEIFPYESYDLFTTKYTYKYNPDADKIMDGKLAQSIIKYIDENSIDKYVGLPDKVMKLRTFK